MLSHVSAGSFKAVTTAPFFGECLKDVSANEGWLTLTLKHRERHGCVVNTVATDALVLKHQVTSIHNAD